MSLAEIINSVGTTRIQGRQPRRVMAVATRELQGEDLLLLSEHRGSKTPQLKEIRQHHHQIARLLSQGLQAVEVSAITGMSQNRISLLQDDPSFIQLLDYYSSLEAEQYNIARADVHEKMRTLGFDSMSELHQRLLDKPEAFGEDLLLKISEVMLDRTGHGKTSTVNNNVTVGFDAETLKRIRGEGDAPSSETRAIAEEDRRALLSFARDSTGVYTAGETIEGSASAGPGLRDESGERTAPEVSE